ncbi:MAG: helix-turn-helix domain-containing protein [Lachnospiraceae bacterium]|nr:helix-turn-helix domain-containing protein [Lachnospiraceae bacterium]
MQVKLSIQEKLKDLRVEKRLTLEELSKAIGISSSALNNYENDDYKDISHYSIVALAKFYNVSTDYLLGLTENRYQQLTPIEELHLDDAAIEKLKSRRFNNRLFSEMICNPAFDDLMSDAEIYVDGIASMQIQNLNTFVDHARNEIIRKYNPADNDHEIKTLEASHISEKEYFTSRIHEDIDKLFLDIKENHKNDSASGSTTPIAQEITKDMEEMSQFHGSPEEKQIILFCRRLGINYSKLSQEEFKTMIEIFKKSPLMKSPINQRGKKKHK